MKTPTLKQKDLEKQAKYYLERAIKRIDESQYGIAESLIKTAIENLEHASELKIDMCEVCDGKGYLEVTHVDNHEYIDACQDCNGFTVGSMGDATGADERARDQAILDGYKLTKTGKIKE